MKRLGFFIAFIGFFIFFSACNNDQMKSSTLSKDDSLKLEGEIALITVGDTSKVSDALRNNILENELDLLNLEQRKYSLDEFDLNGDGKVEYFVGFANDFFCSADGCSYFILNHDGSLNSRIIDSYAPFMVLSTKTNGWYDILINSNSASHKLSFDKKTYPSHPWTLPIIDEDSVINENHFLKIVLEGRADYTF
jgi:hypothetical protein